MDWRGFFSEHRVPYIERGANVKRGEINIQCPFCGSADPSFHMGFNLETGWWACWRNSEHRGKSPLRVIVQLLQVPYWKARQLAGLTDDDARDPDGFDAVAARLLGRNTAKIEQVRRNYLEFDQEIIPLSLSSRVACTYFDYLALGRGFGVEGTWQLAEDYNVRYAKTGAFRGRIIFPYYVEGELVAWTGRAIGHSEVRYRDLEHDDCLIPIKETLYNYDCVAEGGKVLAVVEGPVDVLKLDLFGRRFGLRSVGLSTNSASEEQLYLLEEAASKFDKLLIMLDSKTSYGLVDSMRMRGAFSSIRNAGIAPVPFGMGDAGMLSETQVVSFARSL